MSPAIAPKMNAPQAFVSSYAPRIRAYGNSLLTPVIPQTTQLPPARTTKRGTTAINYAEDGFDDEDFDDSEGPRRPTGLRSLRRDEAGVDKVGGQATQLGKELTAPVEIQGVWRDWMGKPKRSINRTERQMQVQSALPLTLIPIRIDLDIQPFRPEAALPLPNNFRDFGIDESLPAYKPSEPTPAYRLKDTFLWNLHEALMTPDQFAKVFVDELDFPAERKLAFVMTIAAQIRDQLQEYAGVALHPLSTPLALPTNSNGRSSTPGFAELFAKQTCADLGLSGEWVPAMTHALYEAVLRLKKEACENGGLVGYGDIDNQAAEGAEAGWRYDNEDLGAEWEPKVELLSKEEIEKREGDRERQIRRMRRETARFSSTANMAGGVPQSDYFANPQELEQPMGRGERSKKKRRFRSLSPVGRDTPSAAAGYGGEENQLKEWERTTWRCAHCKVWGSAVWGVRDGPGGPRTLCTNCGLLYERDKKLPPWSKDLFEHERAFGTR
ncbi:Chromatin structure remodeling complex protein sfh1 [Coniosporium tulheliwenetii]|uniref:Chromatin structure remodeling complex protein sfh1 n=1 Tax=Coniosporium tulheliwenetii TaxID=3383036 RepID=A0ACC2ZKC6_9PEZI|nr:Chromatin structure remodeling complex protein sfh1 [Cladosporium sp. JES 115]